MKDVAQAAAGRWREILGHCGIALPEDKKHHPCPACGGKDRFKFDDRDGRGTFYCSGCGNGDGFDLLARVKGMTLSNSINTVRDYLGVAKGIAPATDDPVKAMERLWNKGRLPIDGGPVNLYLKRRLGRHAPPLSIREAMSVYDPETKKTYPAMIAKVASTENRAVNLHITYLTKDGHKAATPKPKRVMQGKLPEGCAIRLAPAADVMGIAEGIETAMAASIMFGMPVWAAVSGAGLSKWTPPAVAKTIHIFADNDATYAGQAKAYALAHRVVVQFKRDVSVSVPGFVGDDWNDALNKFNAIEAMSIFK